MTNSMIPYSFIPGTKAKAGEVNANFIALAKQIEKNKTFTIDNIAETQNTIMEILSNKADKAELTDDHTVSTTGTDLNDYKTSGTYIFSDLYTPINIPKGNSGMLTVSGDCNSTIKQVWYNSNNETFMRSCTDSTWTEWVSSCGNSLFEETGHLRLTNGLLIQWGHSLVKPITFPIAYTTFVCPMFQKEGWSTSTERSDTGFSNINLTGFEGTSNGVFKGLYWMAIGY